MRGLRRWGPYPPFCVETVRGQLAYVSSVEPLLAICMDWKVLLRLVLLSLEGGLGPQGRKGGLGHHGPTTPELKEDLLWNPSCLACPSVDAGLVDAGLWLAQSSLDELLGAWTSCWGLDRQAVGEVPGDMALTDANPAFGPTERKRWGLCSK